MAFQRFQSVLIVLSVLTALSFSANGATQPPSSDEGRSAHPQMATFKRSALTLRKRRASEDGPAAYVILRDGVPLTEHELQEIDAPPLRIVRGDAIHFDSQDALYVGALVAATMAFLPALCGASCGGLVAGTVVFMRPRQPQSNEVIGIMLSAVMFSAPAAVAGLVGGILVALVVSGIEILAGTYRFWSGMLSARPRTQPVTNFVRTYNEQVALELGIPLEDIPREYLPAP